MSSLYFVIITFGKKRKLLVLFIFINMCFQFQKPGEKCLSPSLTLTSHLANVFFHAPYIKSNRHEHVFLITVGDVWKVQWALQLHSGCLITEPRSSLKFVLQPGASVCRRNLEVVGMWRWEEKGPSQKAPSAESGNSSDLRNLTIVPLAGGTHIK